MSPPLVRNQVWKGGVSRVADLSYKLLFDRDYFSVTSALVILAEIFLCQLIIHKVPYTEIDWSTYMQQVDCFLNGTRDYSQIYGDTGPLPYPSGHLWAYTFLYWLTYGGTSLKLGQQIFSLFYLANLFLVHNIYRKSSLNIPPYVLVLMSLTSYRVHSIFILRLFNDPIAMLLLYAAVNLFLYNHFTLGCVFYSLSVSIKMNILLFSPALFIILIIRGGIYKTFSQIALCALVQIILALPFLTAYPFQYLLCSFNLGRMFLYKWTVNWRFVPESIFLDRRFHLLLMVLHLSALVVFILRFAKKLKIDVDKVKHFLINRQTVDLRPDEIVLPLFLSNFIGICFSRTLHYQFYVWYYHSILYILWSARVPAIFRVLLLFPTIEYCWNVYPSTNMSSLLLMAVHMMILFSALFLPRSDILSKESGGKKIR